MTVLMSGVLTVTLTAQQGKSAASPANPAGNKHDGGREAMPSQRRRLAISVETPGAPSEQASRSPLLGALRTFYGSRHFSGSAGLRW